MLLAQDTWQLLLMPSEPLLGFDLMILRHAALVCQKAPIGQALSGGACAAGNYVSKTSQTPAAETHLC